MKDKTRRVSLVELCSFGSRPVAPWLCSFPLALVHSVKHLSAPPPQPPPLFHIPPAPTFLGRMEQPTKDRLRRCSGDCRSAVQCRNYCIGATFQFNIIRPGYWTNPLILSCGHKKNQWYIKKKKSSYRVLSHGCLIFPKLLKRNENNKRDRMTSRLIVLIGFCPLIL